MGFKAAGSQTFRHGSGGFRSFGVKDSGNELQTAMGP